MKKILVTALFLLAASILNTASAEEEVQALVVDNGSGSGSNQGKGKKDAMELVCHKGQTILVNANSNRLTGHLAHGDSLGECGGPGQDPE